MKSCVSFRNEMLHFGLLKQSAALCVVWLSDMVQFVSIFLQGFFSLAATVFAGMIMIYAEARRKSDAMFWKALSLH